DIYLTPDDKWRLKTELSEIIPTLSKAIIYKEDKYFYYHPGINPFALLRAAFNNLIYFRKTSGASTITMQVARLLYPKRRTYINKIWEVFQAFQLEWHYSKKEILQLYLNLVPYGGNIEGVKSAAFFYFNQMPHKLSLAQIVTLTIVPNRPTSLRLGKNNAFIQKERDRWLKRFLKAGVFSEAYVQGALSETLNAQRQDAPGKAPHLCTRLHHRYPDQHNIFTFIRPDIQEKVRQLSFDYLQRVKHLGIYNASILVLNNENQRIEAYIGSADFEDKAHQGEVDGIQGIRSPGSTLKPLVYALAMDQGMITPKTVVEDVPENFSGFEPENFYKNYQGKLTVEQALIQSLNIPQVRILEKIGLSNFIDEMTRTGFRQVAQEKDRLGLSMVLGGCGVRLEELMALYGAFANGGTYLPLSFCQLDSQQREAYQVVSPEAAYALTEMLSQAQRPDLPNAFENSLRRPKVAWKTGTSFGRKDAWSIGYNAHYTIGVWLGNFDGTGGHQVVGARVATPLLFEVFNAVDFDRPRDWFRMPKNLSHRWVCSESGQIPQDFCKNQIIDYYLPNVSQHRK
ncbi:MAG: penicillin-binding protein 1C, partial [Bacteroidota bacterium]